MIAKNVQVEDLLFSGAGKRVRFLNWLTQVAIDLPSMQLYSFCKRHQQEDSQKL